MNPLLVWLIWTAISMGISYGIYALTKKDPEKTVPKPNEFDVPVNEEGGKLPIIFGTCWVENPVIAWWGDTKTTPIRIRENGEYYIVGYYYYVGEHDIICQGVCDGVKGMRVGDQHIWPNADDPTQMADDTTHGDDLYIYLNLPNVFGGYDKGGGIVGQVDIQYGWSYQTLNVYLESMQGTDVSASRGVTAAIHRQVKIGTSPYLTGWRYLVKRTTLLTTGANQWYLYKSTINGHDINPAHIIRECYTDSVWGLGMDESLFDDTVWMDVADTLYDEGFGMSIKWEKDTQSLEDFVGDVLRHIEALIYEDHSTGKIVLKLLRDDYTISELETFDESDIEAIESFDRGVIHRVPNITRLEYWNLVYNETISIIGHNLALLSKQNNAPVWNDINYYGVNNDDTASVLLQRHMKQISGFPAAITLRAKRTMAHLHPGDVFILSWAPRNLYQMVVRLMRPNYGTLEEGTLKLECLQEIGMPIMTTDASGTTLPEGDSIFHNPEPNPSPPTPNWPSPISEPIEISNQILMESPFYILMQRFGLSTAIALTEDAAYIIAAAEAPSEDAIDYELMLKIPSASEYVSDGRSNFTAVELLPEAWPMDATEISAQFEGMTEDVEVNSYATVDNEIVKIKSVVGINMEGNEFIDDPNCIAWWRLEPTTRYATTYASRFDSIGSNDWVESASEPRADETNYKEGTSSALCENIDGGVGSSFYYHRQTTESNFDSNFPLRSDYTGDVKISVCLWFRPLTVPPSISMPALFSKYKSTGGYNGRTFRICLADAYTPLSPRIYFYKGYNSGANAEYTYHSTVLQTNKWYHLGVTYDDSSGEVKIRLWDDTAQSVVEVTDTHIQPISLSTTSGSDFGLGYQQLVYGQFHIFDGQIDDCVVFDRILSSTEIDLVRQDYYTRYGAGGVEGKLITFARGVLDTVPATHAADSEVWFIGASKHFVNSEFTFADEPSVKYLPRTAQGQLDEDDATEYDAYPMDSRQVRPYPPGNVKFNGVSYPTALGVGDVTITWSHRDRTQQTSYIVEHSDSDVGPEDNVTYTLEIYDDSNTLLRVASGLTGTSYVYTNAMELSDRGTSGLSDSLRFVIYSVRTGYGGESDGGRSLTSLGLQDKQYWNTGDDSNPGTQVPDDWLGFTFTAGSDFTLYQIKLKLYRANVSEDADPYVSIRNASGNYPTGGDLAYCLGDSDDITVGQNPDSSYGTWITFDLSVPVNVVSGQKYTILLTPMNGVAWQQVSWRLDNDCASSQGVSIYTDDGGSTWHLGTDAGQGANAAYMFELWGL